MKRNNNEHVFVIDAIFQTTTLLRNKICFVPLVTLWYIQFSSFQVFPHNFATEDGAFKLFNNEPHTL